METASSEVVSSDERARSATDAPSARSFLEEAFARVPDAPLLVVLPAPIVDPLCAIRRLQKRDAWLLARGDESFFGLGEACATTIEARDATPRFAALREGLGGAPSWTIQHHASADAELAARAPVAFVGLAFTERAAADEAWSELGSARLVWPRWSYLRRGESAVLVFATRERWARQSGIVLGEYDALVSALEQPMPAPRAPRAVAIEHLAFDRFAQRVADAHAAFDRGSLRKVVAARRTAVTTAKDLIAEDVLRSLPARDVTQFLVRRGGTTFVGATPERLFRKQGTELLTEALAGTSKSASSSHAAELLESAKDRDEHLPVVETIASTLAGLGAEVRVEPEVQAKHVANLVHLRTGIRAVLPSSVSALDVLEALHPTPAVGGVPREAALQWIEEHEAPRGWYASPIGWIDARGDADFYVALRSGVLRGGRAWVYAGGGLVSGSEAAAEYREAALKMEPFLRALGVTASIPAYETEVEAQ